MNRFAWPEPPRQTAYPIAKPGYTFILAGAFITAIFALLELTAPALIGLAATLFVCYFFRDPDRVVTTQPDAVVSPADGKVVFAGFADNSPFAEGRCRKIGIFMSVFNVHVNRIPYGGVVKQIRYQPGKFIAVNLEKAASQNEHNAVLIETEAGQQISMVQIAGLIARRIICGVQPHDAVNRGERFGMICFGSRVDVYLPEDAQVDVRVGEKVKAGASILGRLN